MYNKLRVSVQDIVDPSSPVEVAFITQVYLSPAFVLYIGFTVKYGKLSFMFKLRYSWIRQIFLFHSLQMRMEGPQLGSMNEANAFIYDRVLLLKMKVLLCSWSSTWHQACTTTKSSSMNKSQTVEPAMSVYLVTSTGALRISHSYWQTVF